MSTLPERELHGLLELLGEVHHAETLAGFRTALLDVLPRVIPAAYTSYNEVSADGRPAGGDGDAGAFAAGARGSGLAMATRARSCNATSRSATRGRAGSRT